MRAFRVLMFAAAVILAAANEPANPAAGTSSGYEVSRIKNLRAGRLEINLKKGAIESISAGADITLESRDPSQPPLRLRADEFQFTNPETGAGPEKIVLIGNVIIDHQDGTITAGHAEWNQKTQTVILTEKPVINSPVASGLRGSRMELDLESGQLIIDSAEAESVSVSNASRGDAGGRDPALLRATDVRDWPGLLSKIKAQGAKSEASPGKRILTLLTADVRKQFLNLPENQTPDDETRAVIIRQLNSVLQRPEFYEESAWQGITLSPDASALLKKRADTGALGPTEVTRLNRLLFEAAFSNETVPVSGQTG
ncbi:MAG: hypothetical protein HY706_10750 [Candidatus Hydrogenedentes bacterium]|nr:hypothetical protein [Candidatus Hydrogenedentota bacterium]